jgi:hypothetical protein
MTTCYFQCPTIINIVSRDLISCIPLNINVNINVVHTGFQPFIDIDHALVILAEESHAEK